MEQIGAGVWDAGKRRSLASLLQNSVFNVCYIAGRYLLPFSYRWYRLTKLLGCPVLNVPLHMAAPFAPGVHRASIQGFRHSANSYLATAVVSHAQQEIHSHVHRLWAIKAAVHAGITPLVVIRPASEVLDSTIRRTQSGWYGTSKALWATALLMGWYHYYTRLTKYRDSICVVTMESITSANRYEAVRALILKQTSIALTDSQDFAKVNPNPLPHAPRDFPGRVHRLLRKCDAVYERWREDEQRRLAQL